MRKNSSMATTAAAAPTAGYSQNSGESSVVEDGLGDELVMGVGVSELVSIVMMAITCEEVTTLSTEG